ncbi:uncharacterized protein [Diabrotica undecimpunctata]|uniref:uncharacterized protein isoform X2 n=1 Tax=Diabrotica undecimpunctata TaxID=50387 RepID=UPI003B637F90
MDSSKTDELTSTMGNVLSTSNKEEKSDSSDATPTSSTDANTNSTASETVSEDPISSTSSDNFDQKPPVMNNKVVGGEIMKVPSSENVNELLEIPVSSEKITEDVEDLVHDLESLLGETSQSFDAPIRPKTAGDSNLSNEVTEKSKDDEDIKNNENIKSNSSLGISSKDITENEVINNEEGCNQSEIENKATEIILQPPTSANNEKEIEENLCDNMNEIVDPTVDSKDSNESEPFVSEEQSINNENISAVDNSIITIEVNKDKINDEKSNKINELTNDDSTSSWELVDLNEAMSLESSVSSTPSVNVEEPANVIANSQNVLDDITSSGDKAGTSLLKLDTEENREAESIQVEATDQTDGTVDLLITENIEKLEEVSKVTSIDQVNKDTESTSSKVKISEDMCVNELKGLEVTSCEAEAVPSEISESHKATTIEETKNVELQMEISSSEVCVQQEESKPQNIEDESSNLEAVGSSANPKISEDISKLDKSDTLEISKEDLSSNPENSVTDDIIISKEPINVNHLDALIPELTQENIEPDVEDKATPEVIVAKETDVTSHIVENIESAGETEKPNEKSNSDILESVKESHGIKEVEVNVHMSSDVVEHINIEKSNTVCSKQDVVKTDFQRETTEDTEFMEKQETNNAKLENTVISIEMFNKCDNSRDENKDSSDIKIDESEGSAIKSVENSSESKNKIGEMEPMDVEPAEKTLSEIESVREIIEKDTEPMETDESIETDQKHIKATQLDEGDLGSNNPDETDSEIPKTEAVEQIINVQKDLELVETNINEQGNSNVEVSVVVHDFKKLEPPQTAKESDSESLTPGEEKTKSTTNEKVDDLIEIQSHEAVQEISDIEGTDQNTINMLVQEAESVKTGSEEVEQINTSTEDTESVRTVKDIDANSHAIESEHINANVEEVKIDINSTEEIITETEVDVNETEEKKNTEEGTDDIVMEQVHSQADVEEKKEAEENSKETENIKEDIKSDIKDVSEAVANTKQVESNIEEKAEVRTDLIEPKEVLVELQEIKDDEVTEDMKADAVEKDECKTSIKDTYIKLDIPQKEQVQSDVEMTDPINTDTEKNEQVTEVEETKLEKTQEHSELNIGTDQYSEPVNVDKDMQNISKTNEDDSELEQETSKVIEHIDEKEVEPVETEELEITDLEEAAPINTDQMDCELVKVSTEESEQIETDDVVVSEPQTEQKLSDNVEAQASEVKDDIKGHIDVSRSSTHQDLLEKNEDVEISQTSEVCTENPEGDSVFPIQSEKALTENISDDVEQIQSSGVIKDSLESKKDVSRLQTEEELSEKIEDVQESQSSEVIKDTPEVNKGISISQTEELPEKIKNVIEDLPSSAFIQDATETDTDISRSENEGDLTEKIEDLEESQSNEVIKDVAEADKDSKSQTDELSDKNDAVNEDSLPTALIKDATEADKDDSKLQTNDLSNSEKIEDVDKTQSSVIIKDSTETDDISLSKTKEVSEKVESVIEDSQPHEVIADTTEAVASVSGTEKELSKKIKNIQDSSQSSEITNDDTESVETGQEISMQTDEVFDPVKVSQEDSAACVESRKNVEAPDLEANQDDEKMEVESDANSVSENMSEAEVEPKVTEDKVITVLESKSEISPESEAIIPIEASDNSTGDKHIEAVDAAGSELVNKTISEPVDDIQSAEILNTSGNTPNEETIVESNENSDHITDVLPKSTEVSDKSIINKSVKSIDTVTFEQVSKSDTELDDNTESTEVLAVGSNSPPCGIDMINVKAIKKSNENCDILQTHILPEGTDLIPVISEDTPTESTTDSCQDHEKQHENKYGKDLDENKETVNNKIENKPNTIAPRKSLAELELAPLQLSEDDDSEEEIVPRLALTPEECVIHSPDTGAVLEPLPQMEQMLDDDKDMIIQTVAPALVDTPDNLETILAVQSLQNIDIPKQDESNISEKERREMEALAMAVQSITDPSTNSYVDDYMTPTIESECLIQGDVIETQDQDISMLVTEMEPVQEPIIDTNTIQESISEAENTAVVDSEKVNEMETQPIIQDNAVSSEPTEIESSNSNRQTEIANIEQDVVETSNSDISIVKSSDIEPNITTSNIDTTNNIDQDVKEVSTSEQLEMDPESSTSDQQSNAVTSFADTESEAVKKPVDTFEDSTEESDVVTSVTDVVKTAEAVTPVDSVEDSAKEVSAIQEPEIDSAPDNTNVSTEAQESLVSEDSTTVKGKRANDSEASTSEKVVCESLPETNFKEDEEKTTTVTTTDNKVEESSVSVTQEHSQTEVLKHNKEKPKSSEKSKKHRKSERSDNFEELTINVDVSEKEKTYSPKVTIKPIKVPDEEVSTTTSITSESEISKGSLKMTITKQSDNTHSILKISDQEHSEAVLDPDEEPIPKLIIKPKIQQVEQQHSPKMSTRSSKHSPTSSSQSAISPRITIKPVVKQQEQPVSPLKIKINTKANTKTTGKDEESNKKMSIKSAAKSNEDVEQLQSPRITIKPIPKPDSEKETNPRLTIKPIKKSEEDMANEEKERTSPKITIKPIVKPQELESAPSQEEEEVKERIVLKINKGNLPVSPTKDPKKREHPTDEDKSERLAKITVKFSKEGGHHIVQQGDDNPLKRHQEELPVPEKNKKQKVDTDSVVLTRSTRHKEYIEGGESKSNSATESKVSQRDQSLECPIEAKRSRKENINDKIKQKENDNAEDVQIIESKVDSPITISEDSRSQDSGSVILLDDGKDDSVSSIDAGKSISLRGSLSVAKSNTPSPVLRKRGRPKRSISPAGDQSKEVEPTAEKEAATQKKKPGRTRKTLSPPKEKEPEPVVVETPSEADSATASPVPKKKMGRPRKVPLEPREDFKNPEDSPKLKEAEKPIESGRPKRSCRGGQSICDTLGIKPRKSRGSGRGRGSMRGVGNRSLAERLPE